MGLGIQGFGFRGLKVSAFAQSIASRFKAMVCSDLQGRLYDIASRLCGLRTWDEVMVMALVCHWGCGLYSLDAF